ncbi:hypothetical protein NHX12_027956 [Muraenolepis orangiensis]|uniref:Uncharacterized protein n=1 Tax=Muraenolepis orangiensis TaxID=630683 RepID=A0A9Q0EHZ1_9TELE|nr:hypothetical protein NHX12_027956 [Muraenolepis orangiensis]
MGVGPPRDLFKLSPVVHLYPSNDRSAPGYRESLQKSCKASHQAASVVQNDEAETKLERCAMAVFVVREEEDPL